MQVQQKTPLYEAEQWTGTQESRDAVTALVGYLRPGLTFEWSVDSDGSLVGVPRYGFPVVIRALHHVVHGPTWGEDTWAQPGGGDRPWEICSPALFANKYETPA